jgi:hypothetical protein
MGAGRGPEEAVHRLRRRLAHERAAAAHERAAAIEDRAAAFMEEHDRPDRAAELRDAAVVNRRAGLEQRRLAASYADPRDPSID